MLKFRYTPRLLPFFILVINTFVSLSGFEKDTLQNFFRNHCLECHDSDTMKGDFDIEKILSDFNINFHKKWARIILRLEAGDMPPENKPKPNIDQKKEALIKVKKLLAMEGQKARKDGRVKMRRLNNTEYENTLHDLFQTEIAIKDSLPVDVDFNGFDNNSNALSISPYHIQQYLKSADKLLYKNIPRTLPDEWSLDVSFNHEREKSFIKNSHNKKVIFPYNDITWFFGETHPSGRAYLTQFSDITRKNPGFYELTLKTNISSSKKPITFGIWKANRKRKIKLLGYFESFPKKENIIKIKEWFEIGESIVFSPYRLNKLRVDRGFTEKNFTPNNLENWLEDKNLRIKAGPAIGLYPIKIRKAKLTSWPPVSYKVLFGDIPLVFPDKQPKGIIYSEVIRKAIKKKGKKYISGLSPAMPEEPIKKVKELLSSFIPKVYRREIEENEILPYFEIASEMLRENYCFEDAMLEAYKAILSSPGFLFLEENTNKLHQHALATRLSLFLWRSAPDRHLRELADKGELYTLSVLDKEIERHINDPKFNRFINDFLNQWLSLKDIRETSPDRNLYPEYYENLSSHVQDEFLIKSSILETRQTFKYILKNNFSILELVDSEYIWANQRLAELYKIPNVEGIKLQKVLLQPQHVRGGLLTQSSILKITANGTNTSPITRGVWILEKILGLPAPPPPPNAGSIEPDTRGSTTIREQLTKHKNSKSCAACHKMIDPPGFALEAFDPIGIYRKKYRSTKTGKASKDELFNGKGYSKVKYRYSSNVDSSGEIFNAIQFSGPSDLKKILRNRPDLITRNLAEKLITFATGCTPEPADLFELDKIVEKVKAKKLGLKTLLFEVIKSPLFTHK